MTPADDESKQRLEKFIEWHDNYDIEVFSIGFAYLNHLILGTMFKLTQSNCLFTAQKKITDPKTISDRMAPLTIATIKTLKSRFHMLSANTFGLARL